MVAPEPLASVLEELEATVVEDNVEALEPAILVDDIEAAIVE